jgi:hypothetical protein
MVTELSLDIRIQGFSKPAVAATAFCSKTEKPTIREDTASVEV